MATKEKANLAAVPEPTPEATPEPAPDTKQYHLSKEERLELQNLQLRRSLLEAQVRQKATDIDNEQSDLAVRIGARLSIDLHQCSINANTGVVTWSPPAEPAT